MKNAFLILFFFLQVSIANAQTICGDEVPGAASPDFTSECSAVDADGDGWPATVDCDDHRRDRGPGSYELFIEDEAGACDALEIGRCEANGTWSCVDSTDVPADFFPGGQNVYWFAETGTAEGDGSIFDPFPWDVFSNTGASYYHDPAPGDVFLGQGGTYDQTWSNGGTATQFYVFNQNATEAHPTYVLMLLPGVIEGQSVSPNQTPGYKISLSDWWVSQGIYVDGGYSTAGIQISESDHNRLAYFGVWDIDGEQNNNLAGVKVTVCDGCSVTDGYAYNNYDRSNATGGNNAQIYVDEVTNWEVARNISFVTGTAYSHCFKNKHAWIPSESQSGKFHDNIGINCLHSGYSTLDCNIDMYNNRFKNIGGTASTLGNAAFGYSPDGQGCFKNSKIRNNSVWGGPLLQANFDDGTVSSPTLEVSQNVITDEATSYQSDGENGFIRICRYCNSTNCALITGGGFNAHDNVYYNSASTALRFIIYPDACGASYTGLTAWKAAGYDTGTVSENPLINSDGVATSTNAVGKGFQLGGLAEPTPTPTATPTPQPIGAGKQSHVRRGRFSFF